MASGVHWIEVDVLRAGERPPEVVGRSDYYVLLKRGGQAGRFEVWFFDLRDRMPTIAVPLRPPFEDVPLDLQAVFNEKHRLLWPTTRPAPAARRHGLGGAVHAGVADGSWAGSRRDVGRRL